MKNREQDIQAYKPAIKQCVEYGNKLMNAYGPYTGQKNYGYFGEFKITRGILFNI